MKILLKGGIALFVITFFLASGYGQTYNPQADGDASVLGAVVDEANPYYNSTDPKFNPEYPYGMPQNQQTSNTNYPNVPFGAPSYPPQPVNTNSTNPYSPQPMPPVPTQNYSQPNYNTQQSTPRPPVPQYTPPPQQQTSQPEVHYIPVPQIQTSPKVIYTAPPRRRYRIENNTPNVYVVPDDHRVIENVEVTPVYSTRTYYRIQVGAFSSYERAGIMKDKMESRFNQDFVILDRGTLYVVQSKNLYNYNSALKKKKAFKRNGIPSIIKTYRVKN